MKIVKHTLCVGALLCSFMQGAKAEAPIPPQLRDKGMTPASVRRTLSFPELSQYSRGSVACTISFSDFYFGYLTDDRFYHLNKWPFSSACYRATDPDPSKPNLADGLSVNFDVTANRWVSDRSRFEAHLRAQGMEEEWVKKYADADQFYELTTQTAKGFAMTRDDVIGDESRRERHLHYCLIREPKAICGDGVMGTLEEIKKRPNTDLTSYALQILRTIEFVDDAKSSNNGTSNPDPAASSPK